MNEGMTCTSCGQPKHQLKAKKSALLSEMTLYLCGECIEKKREPRFIIILCGRMNGWESVKKYLKDENYVGAPIEAKDLV